MPTRRSSCPPCRRCTAASTSSQVHYRRYDRSLLSATIEASGLKLVEMHSLDVVGVLPDFLMYRLLNVPTLDAGSSKVYDSLTVPVSRFIQNRVDRPALGKNLLAVARRPQV